MNKLIFAALSLLCCFSNNMKAANETTSAADIFNDPLIQLTLIGCGGGQTEQHQIKLLDETLIPNARKERDQRCPSFFKRLISTQTGEEKAACEQAKNQVFALELMQKALLADSRFAAAYARCGNDEACLEKVRAEVEAMARKLEQDLLVRKNIQHASEIGLLK